jgi:hypothetical protein
MSSILENKSERFKNLLARMESQRETVIPQWMKDVIVRDIDFILSLSQSFATYNGLSPRQHECFEKVEAKYQEDKLIEERQWYENFSSEHREKMKIVAQYYMRQGQYYYSLSEKALKDDNFIPSEKQYKSFVENKYASKVLEEHYKKPSFEENSLVAIRSVKSNSAAQYLSYPNFEVRPSLFYHHANKVCLVLKTDAAPVYNSCRGASQYLVLPIGQTSPIIVEERFLKKYRKK